ncbi:4-carboxy-4-hydroxy-2-oxoadipate aldolase/oxaloacetate decarboxylase [Microbacterium sp. ZXX196]|uniref:4-carboxy-4-hydroxy-2-oxoadipate aldolase/oxaloacetate decarboxylase n=1 Tax=Microbacterium sp. ZXX196 TaxID=2609291 RepID=UPI0012B7BACE|nr:4-carboxy-4-hydroxy-2-oxoadipate aldolase/oxaloacetate decarboxylase [Microbacterium sp. ZXX196]MTE23337.1 4-carboxy-4-hydroxy-2-oxoadipate aldolase/oxaloacetate decarboxylase [Microbacterium sp. ZXX196]
MVHVTTKIDRADPADVARVGQYTAATIHEAQGRRGSVSPAITPIDRNMSFVGSAFTVACAPRDNLMLQVAIHYAQPGDVLVVQAGALAEAGMFGDVLGNACKAKGIAALVTDAGVRDTQELRALGLPVFSGSISIRGTVKETLGALNQPIVFGGEIVRPGDIVKGDADGIVVVRREEAAEVADLSAARDAHEAELIQKYWAGGTTIDLCSLTDVLKAKGLTTDIEESA